LVEYRRAVFGKPAEQVKTEVVRHLLHPWRKIRPTYEPAARANIRNIADRKYVHLRHSYVQT